MSSKPDALASLSQPDATASPIKKPSSAPMLVSIGVVGFLLLFAIATWDAWFPKREVSVVRVHAQRSTEPQAQQNIGSGNVAFQAAGWVEADPQETNITALISGVVASVSVVDGQAVKQGQEIARLDDTDFKIHLANAEAELAEAQAQVDTAKEQIAVAQTHVNAHDYHHAVAEAVIAQRNDEAKRLTDAALSISEGDRRQAQLALATAKARLDAVHSDLSIQEATVKERQAQLKIREAQLQKATVKRNKAKLDLERCIIKAPIEGTIQELFARPGRKQMLSSDNVHSTTVATLYNPKKLQVRVDVALDDTAGLFIGQKTTITCNALPGQTFTGEVTRLLGIADIARNTLQAKVRIDNPVELLRPDMLVKVQFLGTKQENAKQPAQTSNVQCFLPKNLVNVSNSETDVWIVDEHNTTQRRRIRVGTINNTHALISDGLHPGEWVVVNAPADLSVGEQVTVKEIDHD